MELWSAAALLVPAVIGFAAASRCLRQNKVARVVCMVLCALVAAACVTYIGLTLFFVDAVNHQPPAV